MFKIINIRNEKIKMRIFNAQGTYNEMCEQYRRETKKVRKEEVEMSPRSSSETIISLSAVAITLPGPPLRVWGN